MKIIAKDNYEFEENQRNMESFKEARKWRFVWHNIIFFSTTNIVALYGIYLCFTKAKWSTILFAYILDIMSILGVSAGAHRMWSHGAYKAKLPLKIINLLMFTLSYQGSVFQWTRDHRSHHKFCDTDADPHNSKRGFFFSHIGWLLLKKHPDVVSKGHAIDMSDIENDPLLRIHRKYYLLWVFIISIAIPAYIPLLWGEDLNTSFIVAVVLRHAVSLHSVFSVNSVAHMWGTKSYDMSICGVDNKVVLLVNGDVFHNYHHTFPWDYRSAELGYMLNISWMFIDLMAKIGWAYDLRTVSKKIIKKHVVRNGDGTHPMGRMNFANNSEEYKQSRNLLY